MSNDLGDPNFMSMVQEMEELRKLKMHSILETRNILKKRKEFENRIKGSRRTATDFMEYIEFEKMVIYDINLRKSKNGNPPNVQEMKEKIKKRIKYLYELAIQAFATDYSVRVSYFNYCRENNIHLANNVMQNLLKTFITDPKVWELACDWYLTQDIGKAITVLIRGIDQHRTHQPLYLKAIELEIKQVEEKDPLTAQKSDYEAACDRIQTYIQWASMYVKDFSFMCDIMKYLECHSFTIDLQKKVIEILKRDYSDESGFWHFLAQREHEGFHTEIEEQGPQTNISLYRVNKAIVKYQEGLTKVSEDKKFELWHSYLNYLIDLKNYKDLLPLAIEKLQISFEEAHKQIKFSDNMYIEWAKICPNAVESGKIIDRGLAATPDSVNLWKTRLQYLTLLEDTENFNQVFKRAILQLKEKALPIWYMALKYHHLFSDHDIIERIYLDAIKQPENIASKMKPEYIEWLVNFRTLREARRMYQILAKDKPYCKKLHTVMARIEKIDCENDVRRLEECLKLSCEQFSHEDFDTRIELMKFYLRHHTKLENYNSTFDYKKRIKELYDEGVNILKHNLLLLSDFNEKYEPIRKIIS